MTIAKSSCAVILSAAFVAAALGGAPARAGVITLDVSATPVPDSGTPAACAPAGCTLGGDIVIDNSPGAANGGFISADVTATGFIPSVGPFTTLSMLRTTNGHPSTFLMLLDSAGGDFSVTFETPTGGSFAGYTGGQFFDTIENADNASAAAWAVIAENPGSFTPAPEPSSLVLMLSALAALGGLLGRKAKRVFEPLGLVRPRVSW
jgi:hypothetical protein